MATEGETDAQALARIRGQSVNPFDPAFAQAHGGGAIIRSGKSLARTE